MLKRPTSASAVRRPSAVQDADEARDWAATCCSCSCSGGGIVVVVVVVAANGDSDIAWLAWTPDLAHLLSQGLWQISTRTAT